MTIESILDNIESTLEGITKGGGYNNDIGLVTRKARSWTDLKPKELPAALIMWTTDEKETRDVQGNSIISTMSVTIQGVVEGGGDHAQRMTALMEDIETALTKTTSTRGDYAMYTNPDMIRNYNMAPNTPYGVFDYTFTIKYHYLRGTP